MPLADRNSLERRAHIRYPVSIPAMLSVDESSMPVGATVVDISLGGALVIVSAHVSHRKARGGKPRGRLASCTPR